LLNERFQYFFVKPHTNCYTKNMNKKKIYFIVGIIITFFLIGVLPVTNAQIKQETINQITLREAQDLMNKTEYVINYPEPDWLIKELKEQVIDDLSRQGQEVPAASVKTATIFIYEGTENSRHIGFGERMSVIKSFYYVFDRFPISELDWQDVIKISAGRWPIQRNLDKENQMKRVFEKIYLRQPDMNNTNDNAMITVVTYGLRPQKIDYEKQKIAHRYATSLYFENKIIQPGNKDWDKMWNIIRGIAYSGAIR